MILKFADMMSLSNIFFVVIVFLYLSLLTETSFMLISSLARHPEFENTLSVFYLISADRCKLGIPNLP